MGYLNTGLNKQFAINITFCVLAVFCLSAFLIASCENPLMEEVWGLKIITFETNGGTAVPVQKLLRSEKVTKPGNPLKEGYIFIGWYEDNEAFEYEWDFNIFPTEAMTLYAKWEAAESVYYTLIFDTEGLDSRDSVSFVDSASLETGAVLETAAFNGDTVTVYYNLEMADTHNWLSLSINGDRVFETETPEAGTYSYTVNHSDADNGVITIHAHSAHSDLILLIPPESVHFDRTGTITFSAHSSNPSGTTYWYTLFRDDLEVDGFTYMQITNGMIPQGIVNEMLRYSGKYHVEAWAQTSDAGYQSQSGSIESDPVFVYEVDVIFNGAISGDTITVNETSHEASFKFYIFSGDTVTLIASPGTGRMVTWSGAGTSDGNTCTVTVTGTTTITAVFANAAVTVTVGSVTTGYASLGAAFAAIGAQAGDFTVTLYENQTLGESLDMSTPYQEITLVSSATGIENERTIEYSGAFGPSMFAFNDADTSLTLGNNITIKGWESSMSPIFNVNNGTLTMLNGSKITESYIGSDGVIKVIGENARFIMSGGSITENYSMHGCIRPVKGTVEITGGSITGNYNDTGFYSPDINYVPLPNSTIAFRLWGSAEIGEFMLMNTYSNPVISLPAAFTGNVAALHMSGDAGDWLGKQIIQAEDGYTLTAGDIAKFALGNFSSSSQAIGFSHYINESGVLVEKQMYDIGDTGPAGGIIIYRDPAGFTVQGYGNPSDEGYFAPYTAYYLEAAPENAAASTMGWSNSYVLIPNLSQTTSDTTDWAIGRGRKNTAIIAAAHPDDTTANNAAKAAAAYSGGGKDDWFLPSKEELNQMYIQIITVGWSSSQGSYSNAWLQDFGNGNHGNYSKNLSFNVRAVRAF